MYTFMFLIWQLWRADIISFRSWSLATILWNIFYNGKDHLQASKIIQRKKIRFFSKFADFLFLCNFSAWHIKHSVSLAYHTTALLLSCFIRILGLLVAEVNCNFNFHWKVFVYVPLHNVVQLFLTELTLHLPKKLHISSVPLACKHKSTYNECKFDCIKTKGELMWGVQQRWETCSNIAFLTAVTPVHKCNSFCGQRSWSRGHEAQQASEVEHWPQQSKGSAFE